MRQPAAVVISVLAMVAVVVTVDVLFFRHHFWPRLIANMGIVGAFGILYLVFRNSFAGR